MCVIGQNGSVEYCVLTNWISASAPVEVVETAKEAVFSDLLSTLFYLNVSYIFDCSFFYFFIVSGQGYF